MVGTCAGCAAFLRINPRGGAVHCRANVGEACQRTVGFRDHAEAAPAVDHPRHYTAHPSGVECIAVVEHMNFNRGNAIKYIWRAGEKDKAREIEDLEKARWYVDREIARLRAAK